NLFPPWRKSDFFWYSRARVKQSCNSTLQDRRRPAHRCLPQSVQPSSAPLLQARAGADDQCEAAGEISGCHRGEERNYAMSKTSHFGVAANRLRSEERRVGK